MTLAAIESLPLVLSRTNTLLMGPVATGKTTALRTLLKSYPDPVGSGRLLKGVGRTVLVVSLEPGFEDSLGDCTCEQGLHVHYIAPLDVDWDTLIDQAERVQLATDIQKITDPNKRDYTQFLDTYNCLANFKCDRCGEVFGPVDKLDESFAVAVDGLTGLTRAAMQFSFGLKPCKTWPEYDAVGQLIENMLRKCISIRASFVLIAHIDREPDPLGGLKLTMHTVGNKLAPRLTKDLFSEIVYTRRDDRNRFWWSTVENNMDLKARKLPFSEAIEPSFEQILGSGP